MKSRYWILLLVALLVVCLPLTRSLFSGEPSSLAQITSDGEVLRIVDLAVDQAFTITTDSGSNTISVQNGSIAVIDATCPDHYCMERGYCNSGAPIVCLPNRLVITFLQESEIDIAVG